MERLHTSTKEYRRLILIASASVPNWNSLYHRGDVAILAIAAPTNFGVSNSCSQASGSWFFRPSYLHLVLVRLFRRDGAPPDPHKDLTAPRRPRLSRALLLRDAVAHASQPHQDLGPGVLRGRTSGARRRGRCGGRSAGRRGRPAERDERAIRLGVLVSAVPTFGPGESLHPLHTLRSVD